MSAAQAQFEIVEGEDGQWHWRLRSKNGEILAHSEQYPDLEAAAAGVDAAEAAFQSHPRTEVIRHKAEA